MKNWLPSEGKGATRNPQAPSCYTYLWSAFALLVLQVNVGASSIDVQPDIWHTLHDHSCFPEALRVVSSHCTMENLVFKAGHT